MIPFSLSFLKAMQIDGGVQSYKQKPDDLCRGDILH